MNEARKVGWFNLGLIVAAIVVVVIMALGGCGLRSGEVVYHWLNNEPCMVISGPHLVRGRVYYVVRYTDNEGRFQACAVERGELRKERVTTQPTNKEIEP